LKPKEECRLPVERLPARNNLLRGVNLVGVTLSDGPELPDAPVQRPVDDRIRPRAKRGADTRVIERRPFS
jgi:hypothetical protein